MVGVESVVIFPDYHLPFWLQNSILSPIYGQHEIIFQADNRDRFNPCGCLYGLRGYIICFMNEEETNIEDSAFRWIKNNEKAIIEKFASGVGYVSDIQPTTLFMAGSPGAGKTEISKRFMARWKQKPIRIDADEIRTMCPQYSGSNAHLFQKAANKGVNILYDYALGKGLNVILDGTFAYAGAIENIERSLKRNRKVEIFFVSQNPEQAWGFTKKREVLESRRVSKEVFINAYFKSQENVNNAKKHFIDEIELHLIIKDFEKDLEQIEFNIQSVDPFIKKRYSRDELEKVLI